MTIEAWADRIEELANMLKPGNVSYPAERLREIVAEMRTQAALESLTPVPETEILVELCASSACLGRAEFCADCMAAGRDE